MSSKADIILGLLLLLACAVVGLMLTIGINGIAICGGSELTVWGGLMALFFATTLPFITGTRLHDFWPFGALFFCGVMPVFAFFQISNGYWNVETGATLGCIVLAWVSAWFGGKYKTDDASEPK